jgi:ubiquinone/menaquinone biosynthesis C-methylase UbiE
MQKERFLESEGNAWLSRNQKALDETPLEKDPLLLQIIDLPLVKGSNVLEIGCGEGRRLAWMQENLGYYCSGIEPSSRAVELANQKGVRAIQGTADCLPFPDGEFDLVIFGFCLYLCDRSDLFKIAAEADRVLKDPGWIIIKDFYTPTPRKRIYHHLPGLFSYKMDYRQLFTWHPNYNCLTHQVRHHADKIYTDDPHEWVALSVIRKNSRDAIDLGSNGN